MQIVRGSEEKGRGAIVAAAQQRYTRIHTYIYCIYTQHIYIHIHTHTKHTQRERDLYLTMSIGDTIVGRHAWYLIV